MQFTDVHVLKSKRKAITKTVIGCILIAMSTLALIYGLAGAAIKIKNADSFYNIEGTYENPAEKAAYIDTEYYIETFAYEKERYEGKYIYAFAADENGCFFVIKAREKAIDKLNEEIDANGKVRIYGYTHKFTDHELRGYALEVLQEMYPDETITQADLEGIIGNYMLKVTKHSLLAIYFEDFFVFFISLFLLIIGAFMTVSGSSKLNKFLAIEHQLPERIAMLENEMHGEGAMWLPELQMYAGENYFISLSNGIDYSKYTDLLMVYKTVHRYNGIKTGDSVNVLIKNGTAHQIAYAPSKVSFKTANLDNELTWLVEKARVKNPDIFFGYDAQVLADLTRRAKNGEFKEHTDNIL